MINWSISMDYEGFMEENDGWMMDFYKKKDGNKIVPTSPYKNSPKIQL